MNKVEWSVSQIFHTNLYWRIATIKVQNWHRRCTLIDFPKAFIIGFQPVVMDKCSQLFMDGPSNFAMDEETVFTNNIWTFCTSA